jgi:hypothetical protein
MCRPVKCATDQQTEGATRLYAEILTDRLDALPIREPIRLLIYRTSQRIANESTDRATYPQADTLANR